MSLKRARKENAGRPVIDAYPVAANSRQNDSPRAGGRTGGLSPDNPASVPAIAGATYVWSIVNGTITSGQGTTSITVDTTGLAGQTIRATLAVDGYGMPCPASCSVSLPIEVKPRKFDEYYDIARNDEKALLDNYAIQMQNEPGAQAYIIVYPAR